MDVEGSNRLLVYLLCTILIMSFLHMNSNPRTPEWFFSVPSFRRLMIFVDGENLVFRYQHMIGHKERPRIPREDVLHKRDVYVWVNNFYLNEQLHEIIRATYYTSAFGDDLKIKEAKDDIRNLNFSKHRNLTLPNRFTPHVFKKKKKNSKKEKNIENKKDGENTCNCDSLYIVKSKGVDIQLTVDILNHVHSDNVDTVLLFSGDGDFIPVMTEVQRCGKQFWVYAFSKGLNPEIEPIADKFICIDNLFFGS